MNNVISFTNYYRSWNLTEEATKRIFYPKNTNDIKKILKKIYSEKEKFLIKLKLWTWRQNSFIKW